MTLSELNVLLKISYEVPVFTYKICSSNYIINSILAISKRNS